MPFTRKEDWENTYG